MVTLDDYQSLIRKVEKLKQLHSEARGAKKQLLRRLKAEFGVSNLRSAIRLLEKLKDREIAASRFYGKAKAQFEQKWAKQLREL